MKVTHKGFCCDPEGYINVAKRGETIEIIDKDVSLSLKTLVSDTAETALGYAGEMCVQQDLLIIALAQGDAHRAGEALTKLLLARRKYDNAIISSSKKG